MLSCQDAQEDNWEGLAVEATRIRICGEKGNGIGASKE